MPLIAEILKCERMCVLRELTGGPVIVAASVEGLETCLWEGRRNPLVTSFRHLTLCQGASHFFIVTAWHSLGTVSVLKAWLPGSGAQGGSALEMDQHWAPWPTSLWTGGTGMSSSHRCPFFSSPRVFPLFQPPPDAPLPCGACDCWEFC